MTRIPEHVTPDRPSSKLRKLLLRPGARPSKLLTFDPRADRARQRLASELGAVDGYGGFVERLEACNAQDGRAHCLHPLCPACLRVLDRWLLWTAPTAMRKALRHVHGNGRSLTDEHTLLTLTSPARLKSARAHAAANELALIVSGFRNRLDDAGVRCAIGLVEFRGVRDNESAFELEFCATLRVLVLVSDVRTSRFLKWTQSPKTGRAGRRNKRYASTRSLRTVGIPLTLLYPRLTETHVSPGPRKANGRPGRQQFRHRKVSPKDADLLVSACIGIDAIDRVFLHGARVTENGHGRAVVRLTTKALVALKAAKITDDAYYADL